MLRTEIHVSPVLTGCKYAVQCGDGPIYVSPAQYDLLKHADADELERLMKAIPLMRLPTLPSVLAMSQAPIGL